MKKRKINTYNLILFCVLAGLILIISVLEPAFIRPRYFFGVMMKNIIELGMMALPMTLIVIHGGIDFSVGSAMILSGLIGGIAAAKLGSIAGVVITLAVGVLTGLLNAVLVVKANVSPMVATMSTFFFYTGIGRVTTANDTVRSFSVSDFLGTTKIRGVPLQVYIFVLFAVIFWFVLAKTTAGRKIYAMGLNRGCTRYSGIDTDLISMILYITTGFVAGFTALIYLGRSGAIKYNIANDFNLNVITIVVLGGVSIAGGKGNIIGTVIATLIMATLNSGLTVLNIPIAMQMVVHGIVFMIALAIGTLMEIHQKNRITKK